MASERTFGESEGPSPDEVRRWVNKLYDRAESDTGRYNATRAASIPRQRGVSAGGQSQGDMDPAAGSFARKWFSAARTKVGPTLPATLPADRLPARPDRALESARPARPAERPAEPLALEAPKAPTGAALELTAGTAQAPATGSLPEIPAQRVAPALPGESRSGGSARLDAALPVLGGGDAAAWPLYEPAPAPAPEPSPLSDPLSDPLSGPLPGLQSTVALPTVPDTAAGALQADLPTSVMEPYGAGTATGATTMYPTALPADPTAAYYAPAPAADLTTATYGAGLPDVAASALVATPAPVASAPVASAPAAPAPVVPIEPPATAPAPSIAFTPGASGGSWPSQDAGHSTKAERVLAFARAQTGRPCVWGAVGPGSYDAPGLTQAAWKAAGVTLPRTAQAQWEAGTQVSLADAQAGDLVFFHDDLGHVGIWSGDGMMIHAPGPGALIREESVFFAGQSAIKGAVRPA
ncbi:NlpC/P60 family protein [Streptomyces sp. NPDC055506]